MAINQGAFSELCLVSVTPKGGTEVQFAAMVETVDIDRGDKDIEQITTLSGGRLIKRIPEDVTTVTFEGYPIGIAATSPGKGVAQMFNTINGSYDSTEPLTSLSTLGRDTFRIAVLLAEDATTTLTSASGATTAAKAAYRMSFYNGYMTSMKPSFTDGILKVTFSFKITPRNKQGTSQILEESTETTTALTALTAYNATNFPEDSTTFTYY